ncbi:MAG TPA: glycogen/starch synthase [Anaerolineaceae bacterium]
MNNPQNTPKGMLQVLFVAAEADPLIKVGGLGDVAGSLPLALRALDPEQTGGPLLDVRVVIPYHSSISIAPDECKLAATFLVPKPGGPVEARAFLIERNGVPIYLIAGEPFEGEMPVYSMNTPADGEKFTFFSLAVLELARALNWQPDVLHANDWHTAPSVYALHLLHQQDDPFFANTHSIISVHNLPFMGGGIDPALRDYGLPPSEDPDLPGWARYFPLPMALATADYIVTVSPTYAKEILTPAFGCGLEHFLQQRADKVFGILNGLDHDHWNPQTDPALVQQYSVETLEKREANKLALLKEFDLEPDPEPPLLILISRMDQQKGVDIAVDALRQITDLPWKAILLGTGDPYLEDEIRRLEADFPGRVRAAIRFDTRLSQRMYAGGDALIMPSRYEPCGLAQMIAMRYGCVPIARSVGGLTDTILDDPDASQSTGFLFSEAAPAALAQTLRRALDEYQHHPANWQARKSQGMRQNFSWEKSAIEYAKLYQSWKNEP